MALELKQTLRLTQQLVMTPQLQQAIKLLQLQRTELVDLIEQEISTNPVLEEDLGGSYLEEKNLQADQARKENAAELAKNNEKKIYQVEWEGQSQGSVGSNSYTASSRENEGGFPYENVLTKKITLTDHLSWQLRLSDFTEEESHIGLYIIGNLNKDGYLNIPFDEIVTENKTSIEKVEKVLKKIQEFDPVGIAARDVQECLLIQVKFFKLESSTLEKILENHFPLLVSHDYQAIAKSLGISLEEVTDSIKLIGQMDPKPGISYSEEEVQYIRPDIFVYKFGDDYVVSLNEEDMPKLKINSYYLDSLQQKTTESAAKNYIREKVRSALWMIRSIHQRQRTIYLATKSIVKFQTEFLDKGIVHLKPLILKDVAEDIGMHESTVSRVTTNKYVHTPQGIFELKYFFNGGFDRIGQEAIASESVKEALRQLIANEDHKKPYSDQHISDLLQKKDIDIARRTVSKYREMLKIPPSSKRRERN